MKNLLVVLWPVNNSKSVYGLMRQEPNLQFTEEKLKANWSAGVPVPVLDQICCMALTLLS